MTENTDEVALSAEETDPSEAIELVAQSAEDFAEHTFEAGNDNSALSVSEQPTLQHQYEKLKSDLESKNQDLTRLKRSYDTLLIDTKVKEALVEAGGSIPLLLPHLLPKIVSQHTEGKTELRVQDPKGNVRQDEAGQPLTIPELVEEYRKHPDFKSAFERSVASGGGMNPVSNGQGRGVVSQRDQAALNQNIEEIAAGKINVSL